MTEGSIRFDGADFAASADRADAAGRAGIGQPGVELQEHVEVVPLAVVLRLELRLVPLDGRRLRDFRVEQRIAGAL